MKQPLSFFSLLLISLTLIAYRIAYTSTEQHPELKVTTWDALGYFLYLPASHIYHDDTSLNWFTSIDQQYALSGGDFYQAQPHENGNRVFKYLRGVSLLQTPWFFLAHAYCLLFKTHPADGFSAPYQYAIAWGALAWVLLSLVLLRLLLLRFYSDRSTALTLFLLIVASNAIQYISIDGGQSHAYIFPLYVLILWFSMRWHETFQWSYALLIGLCIGVATISRPTEAVMLFIPLLWNRHDKSLWQKKWETIRVQPAQIALLLAGGFLGILPQLLYWKRVTGSWIYDVGSKWDFLAPHARVLFGWEKGWFIYTPVTIFFVLGLWFLKGKPFRASVITFCLLNIYIIIAWHIWRYGGSYSTRALVQSYPVFSLALAALLENVLQKKGRFLLWPLAFGLAAINLFQIAQYNRGILHYDDMNRLYYGAIFLNPHPTARDMSLLDTDEFVRDEQAFSRRDIVLQTTPRSIQSGDTLCNTSLSIKPGVKSVFLKVSTQIDQDQHRWRSHLLAILTDSSGLLKQKQFRLNHPLCKEGTVNDYVFYVAVPARSDQLNFFLKAEGAEYRGRLLQLRVEEFVKP